MGGVVPTPRPPDHSNTTPDQAEANAIPFVSSKAQQTEVKAAPVADITCSTTNRTLLSPPPPRPDDKVTPWPAEEKTNHQHDELTNGTTWSGAKLAPLTPSDDSAGLESSDGVTIKYKSVSSEIGRAAGRVRV